MLRRDHRSREIIEFAEYLGIDPVLESEHLWIAEEALTAPLPYGWEEYETRDGGVYFHNAAQRRTQWQHPSEEDYRELHRRCQHSKRRQQRSLARLKLIAA